MRYNGMSLCLHNNNNNHHNPDQTVDFDCFFVSILNMIRRHCQHSRIQKSLHLICRAQLACRQFNLHSVDDDDGDDDDTRNKSKKKKEKQNKQKIETETVDFKNKLVKFYFRLQVHAIHLAVRRYN